MGGGAVVTMGVGGGAVGGTRVVTGGGVVVAGIVPRVTGTVVLAEVENRVAAPCVSGGVAGASDVGVVVSGTADVDVDVV